LPTFDEMHNLQLGDNEIALFLKILGKKTDPVHLEKYFDRKEKILF
jgi:hypothetical protein